MAQVVGGMVISQQRTGEHLLHQTRPELVPGAAGRDARVGVSTEEVTATPVPPGRP